MIFGIKILLQILEDSHDIFRALNKDPFIFSIMIIIFTLFHGGFVKNQLYKDRIIAIFSLMIIIFIFIIFTLSVLEIEDMLVNLLLLVFPLIILVFCILEIIYVLFHEHLVKNREIKKIEKKQEISKEFKIWSYVLLVLYLILSLMFLSIDILDLLNAPLHIAPLDRAIILLLLSPAPPPPLPPFIDIFYISFINEFGIVLFCIIITYLMNRMRNMEARITNSVLKKVMIISSFITYFLWSYLSFLFVAYLGNSFLLGSSFFLDFRVQIITTIGIYSISFFYFLKYKYLPESGEISKGRLQEAINKKEEDRIEEMKDLVLKVEDLKTYFYTEEGVVKALEEISLEINKGEVLGLVGETGCGKTVTALSILQIIRDPGVIEAGRVFYKGEDLLKKNEEEMLKYRGKEITMIFQDPLLSLNPVFKIGKQISEVYLLNMEEELTLEALKNPNRSMYGIARDWGIKMLTDLNIPHAERIYDLFPHELSGGMRQRVQIAMALACSPSLLIADEPTTALDVTVQNQILKLMKDLLNEYDTSILFITHDLGIISKVSDKVAVMYSGYIVEYGTRKKLFGSPIHPYTETLLKSIPKIGEDREKLEVIPGSVPNLIYPPSGCRFHPRCTYRFKPCDSIIPRSLEIEPNYYVRCHLYDPKYEDGTENSRKKIKKNYSP
jgi:oligopeptide/dipeptide ABC transporter ATP-binding protein